MDANTKREVRRILQAISNSFDVDSELQRTTTVKFLRALADALEADGGVG